MKNPIWKAYQKFDDVVMYGVNKGVHAWNWTFGETKADLANHLLTVAPVFEAGGIMMTNITAGTVVAVSALFASHVSQKENKRQEQVEESAQKKGLLINPDNKYAKFNKSEGIAYGALSVWAIQSELDNLLLTGVGNGIRSSSHYIMRADYLPRGKNVVDRVKDKLADLADSIQDRELAPTTFYEKE